MSAALLAPMLAEHRHGTSCAWTNMYPVKSVVATFPGYIADAEAMAALLASVQGWDCVRSRSHNSILPMYDLDDDQSGVNALLLLGGVAQTAACRLV
jgi:hypothetical protein